MQQKLRQLQNTPFPYCVHTYVVLLFAVSHAFCTSRKINHVQLHIPVNGEQGASPRDNTREAFNKRFFRTPALAAQHSNNALNYTKNKTILKLYIPLYASSPRPNYPAPMTQNTALTHQLPRTLEPKQVEEYTDTFHLPRASFTF